MYAIIVVLSVLLTACSPLGVVQEDSKFRDSDAACYRVESLVMGKGVATRANSSLKGGSVTINPETCAITVTNEPPIKAVPLPGTVR